MHIAKGFIIYYLQLANLIVRLTQLLAAKIEAQIAQMLHAEADRKRAIRAKFLALQPCGVLTVMDTY